jgi:putative ABC transport system permease protein
MIITYLKTAWRNIVRQKGLNLINIFGLSVGIAAFILLFIYIRHETSFDRYHVEGNKIYRVLSSFGGEINSILPRTMPGVAGVLAEQVPEVNQVVRIKPEYYTIKQGDKSFDENLFFHTDSSYYNLFTINILEGNLEEVFRNPSSIAITQLAAHKLFGDKNPVGQIVEAEQRVYHVEEMRMSSRFIPLKVSALLEDPPKNSHLQFEILQSYDALDPTYSQTFSNDVFVYFKTGEVLRQADKEHIAGIIKEYATSMYGENYRDILSHDIQSLYDIHLGARFGYDIGRRGNLQLIFVFGAVAFFILFIAVINFVNLVTARSEKRAMEAAIRKVSGANRWQIIVQFIGEAILVCLIALLLALLLAEIFTPPFSNLLNRDLSLMKDLSIIHLVLFFLFVPIVGILAGAYPALVFSGYQPMQILRGKARGGSKNPLLRIVLVVIQFSISIILIVAVLVFNRQIQYMKQADLGFEPESVLVFSGLSNRLVQSYDALKAELLMHPGITHVASSQAYPGTSGSGMSLRTIEQPESMLVSAQEYRIGRDFHETFGMKLKEGRWFDFDMQTDLENFIINETAAKSIGLNDPVGQEVVMWRRKGRIIGMVEDFHFSSLKNEITPLVISAYNPAFYHISVKTDVSNQNEAVNHLRNTFEAFDPNYVFEEWYLGNFFKSLYKQEENNNTILNYASFLAIIIAMLGVLGLSSYIIVARTKEIGIRKVLGASRLEIIAVLIKDISKWVLVANLIAIPVAWVVMSNWLESFPYRISLASAFFIIASASSFVIVLITISGQTFLAAKRNPVDALKGE